MSFEYPNYLSSLDRYESLVRFVIWNSLSGFRRGIRSYIADSSDHCECVVCFVIWILPRFQRDTPTIFKKVEKGTKSFESSEKCAKRRELITDSQSLQMNGSSS
ncbi:hypothetical protein CEXT_472261 [Caerostris extrusa]|uniref:Uncharacterized protein n=1 Tax=Caerostris extrusa TaxID=172846 RepID=A0AAV4T1E1_CAEEX|nr:hypothetical protein CEXT_472261 [Caerostris extrusa]